MATLADSEMQSLSAYVHKAYGSTDYEIAGACTLLWPWAPGPIAGSKAVLVRLPDGRRVWAMAEGMAIPPDRISAMLRRRASAYRDAIAETEALLMMADER
jgi:hypothetical protein